MGDHPGAGFLGKTRRTSEVIGMGVGHDHRVDVSHLEIGLLEAILDGAPGPRSRKPRVDDGGPVGVGDRVAVDVPQPRHADGKLHPQHVPGHFGDEGPRRLLFLSPRHWRNLVNHEPESMEPPAARTTPRALTAA